MNKAFKTLAQKNIDHYNRHPKTHMTIIVVYLGLALVALDKMFKRILSNQDQEHFFWK